MPFHRFEGLKSYRFNPHLSTAEGPVIEGEFMHYLYIKDRTWTLIGAAADEALPDKALSANKVAEEKRSLHEIFLYVIRGAMEADVGGEKRRVTAGGVIQVPRGAAYRWTVRKGEAARYAAVRSLPRLEAAIRKHGAADNWRG